MADVSARMHHEGASESVLREAVSSLSEQGVRVSLRTVNALVAALVRVLGVDQFA